MYDEKLTSEQVRASTSNVMCICGHRERDHVVPDPDDPEALRECFPVPVDEDDEENMGCDCEFFTEAKGPGESPGDDIP